MVWVFVGAIACLFCYVMGYCIGEAVTNEKWRNTRGQMEIDEDDNGKELKIKDVITKKNDSEKD